MTGEKDILIQFIDGIKQKYNTCGDYWTETDKLVIKISKQNLPKKNLLILIHEMIEWILCTDKGITDQEITDFDLQWEKDNPTGIENGLEPGADINAPYYKQHFQAEIIERQLAALLNIDWQEYEQNLIYK